MDAFKLLSRSTTLSRQSGGKPKSSNHTQHPANKYVARPNLIEEIPSSKKRKRGKDVAELSNEFSGVDIDSATDFFRNSESSIKDVSHADANKSSEPGLQDENDVFNTLHGNEADAGFSPLPEEECRQMLEAHKIKITKLYPTEEDLLQQEPSTKKKKKKQQALEQATQSNDNNDKKKKKKKKLDVVPQPLTSFSHLISRWDIDARLAQNLAAQGYTTPTEIQLSALPLLLGGGDASDHGSVNQLPFTKAAVDLLAVAPTGSGKTLAYLIPVINFIARHKADSGYPHNSTSTRVKSRSPRAIIMAPTKELAAQIVTETRNLARGTGISVSRPRKNMRLSSDGLEQHLSTSQALDSGSSDNEEEKEERDDELPADTGPTHRRIPDILVSAPLSLVKAITSDTGEVRTLASVDYLILDEADVLLDPMFRTQTLKVISACTSPDLRTSLWSATMGSSIETLAMSTILTRRTPDPSGQKDTTPLLRLVIGLKDSAIPTSITHKLTYCHNEPGKLLALRQLLRPAPGSHSSLQNQPLNPPFLIFTQTIPRAIALASELKYDIPAPITTSTRSSSKGSQEPSSRVAVLHADLSPTARTTTITRFRQGEIWLLITTDLLSRGVDFPSVNAVVNYDFPNSPAAYVHRVGRTGRTVRRRSLSTTSSASGETRRAGVAVTFVAEEDVPYLRNVVNVIEGAERAAKAKAKHNPEKTSGSQLDGLGDEGTDQASAVKEWMRTALPKPTKRQRQELKKKGVEARRPPLKMKSPASALKAKGGEKGRSVGKRFQTRISTKSGFDRRLEKRRRDTVRANRMKKREEAADGFDGE